MSDLKEFETLEFASHSNILTTREWFVCRFYFYFHLKPKQAPGFRLKITHFKLLLHGVRSVGRIIGIEKNRPMLVTNSSENVFSAGILRNRILDGIIEEPLGFFVEKITSLNNQSNPNAFSFIFFQLLEKICCPFWKLTSLEERNLVEIARLTDAYCKLNNVEIFNPVICYKRFSFYVKAWCFLLWIVRPSKVLITDYYNSSGLGLIHAAKKIKLPVVEIQHGVISSGHPAYFFPSVELNRITPDELWHFLPIPLKSGFQFYINQKNMKKIEHPARKIFQGKSKKLIALEEAARAQFKKIVLVTLQDASIHEFFSKILELSKASSEYCFLLLPRLVQPNTKSLQMNTKVVSSFSFYELIQISDVHITHYSTCAIEAPEYGVRSIIWDIDGMGHQLLGDFLNADIEGLEYTRIMPSLQGQRGAPAG